MVQPLQKKAKSPLSLFAVQFVDLLMFVVVVINVIANVGNVVDFQWSPSNLHIYPHQSAKVPHPQETLCHVPS